MENFFRKKSTHSRRLISFSDLLSCLNPSKSNSRLPIERLNKSRTSSLSQYQSVGPLLPTESNISKVIFIFIFKKKVR